MMFSYRICLGGGLAIAALLFPTTVLAEPLPQVEPTVLEAAQEADPLGGPITPSNLTQFHADPAAPGDKPQVLPQSSPGVGANVPPSNTIPFQWQSELLDNQRRSQSGFPVFNVNFD